MCYRRPKSGLLWPSMAFLLENKTIYESNAGQRWAENFFLWDTRQTSRLQSTVKKATQSHAIKIATLIH